MKINKLAIFDFDGTISKKDSSKEFLKFKFGKINFLYNYYVRFLPRIFFCYIGSSSYTDLKLKRISIFFKNKSTDYFKTDIKIFSKIFFKSELKIDALKRLDWHKKNNHQIVILSASLNILLEEWCKENNYFLISNNLTCINNIFTGELNSNDCNGAEKLVRLKFHFNLDDFDYIYGYGDTYMDDDFLNIVDDANFCIFKS